MADEAREKGSITLSSGDVAYYEAGPETGIPVLFIHGIPTSGYLWRDVISFIGTEYHCYSPDLYGLGDSVPRPGLALHMENQAEMLLEFMTVLGHETFHVVCHDQGGAAAQIIMARHGERLERVVLTDCVCYDNWPVPFIAGLQKLGEVPFLLDFLSGSGFMEWLEKSTIFSAFRRGVFDPSRLTDASIHEYLRPLTENALRRQNFISFLKAGNSRYTMAYVPELKQFNKPVLILWAADDYYISPSWGARLAEDIPGVVDFKLIPFCGHFWQEEKASEFSSYIHEFLRTQDRRKQRSPLQKRRGKKAGPDPG